MFDEDTQPPEPTSRLSASQKWLRYERYPYLLAKWAMFAGAAYGVWALLAAVEAVIFPVFLSLLIAYLLDPAIDKFEARGFSRTTAILLLMGFGVTGTVAFTLFLWPTVADLFARVTTGIPALLDLLENRLAPWVEENLGYQVPATFSEINVLYGQQLKDGLPALLKQASSGIGDFWTNATTFVGSLLNLVMIPIFTFYFLRDFDTMRLKAATFLPEYNRDWILDRIVKMDEVVGAWFRGQVEVAFILGALYAVGLSLTFGLSGIGWTPGIAIGLFAGLLNIVPYLGFLVGFGLSILLAVLNWHGIGPVVGVLVTFAAVQALEGYVITPKIVGEKVGLSPVVVIISLLLGNEILNLLGMLLALPVAGIIRVLLPDAIHWYQASEWFRGDERALEE